MSDLFIMVVLHAKSGREEELRRDLIAVVEPSRMDEGNLRYELFVDQDDPRRFVFMEHWADQEAQHRHDTDTRHIRYFQEHGAGNVEKIECFYKLDRIA